MLYITYMTLLDSREEIQKYDKHKLLASIEQLPAQIQDAWQQVEALVLPDSYQSVKNVVVSGMGGSALGAWVLKYLYKKELQVPFEICSDYILPGYVSSDTLVVLSSYSGTTEETLAAGVRATELGAKVAVITSGGKLLYEALHNSWPVYKIDPKQNPSGQPRMAIGYAIMGQLAFFSKLGLINTSLQDILNLVDNLEELVKRLTVEQVGQNTAKLLAYQAFDKQIILIAAEHLIGGVHVTNNQLNENAKTLTAEWHLPEFNHHYMEALSYPARLKEDVLFLLYQSQLYSKELVKRVELSRQVIEKMGFECQVVTATAPTKLEQIFEVITLGAFVNFYLAMLYKIDPAPIPNVDWFKSEMKKYPTGTVPVGQ